MSPFSFVTPSTISNVAGASGSPGTLADADSVLGALCADLLLDFDLLARDLEALFFFTGELLLLAGELERLLELLLAGERERLLFAGERERERFLLSCERERERFRLAGEREREVFLLDLDLERFLAADLERERFLAEDARFLRADPERERFLPDLDFLRLFDDSDLEAFFFLEFDGLRFLDRDASDLFAARF